MLLRESSEGGGDPVDLAAVTQGDAADSGVPHAAELGALVDAALRAGDLQAAREKLRSALGDAALVDAAAVIGGFQRTTRIADATGIPLDAPMATFTGELRREIGVEAFGSAGNTPRRFALLSRLVAPIARPMLRVGLRALGFSGPRERGA